MGHSYNHGLVTSMKGAAFEAIRITGMNTSPCTISEQCASGFVSSATIAAGVVTLQFAAPYPPKMVVCIPGYSSDDAVTDIITARVDSGSYNATTGQLVINLSNDDDAGAPIAASPAAADELHLFMVFKRYTGLSA
jgi:hypothetical protein